MPAISAISIWDALATPVLHTFSPLSITGNYAIYEDRSSGISVGFPRIHVWVSPPSKTSRLHKVRVKIVRPTLETISNSTYSGITPAPTKAYDTTVDMTFFLPERSIIQDRKDILAYAIGFLNDSVGAALVRDQETVY